MPRLDSKNSSLIECVPNVSEAQNTETVRLLENSITNTRGVKLLHTDIGQSANRTVFSFVGEPSVVIQAAYNLISSASQLIDMRRHSGEHPRLGAVDVCPFIPLKNSCLVECDKLANELAKKVAEELDIPVYLYAESAKFSERKKLANIRKGEFERLEEKIKLSEWKPDYGDTKAHPSFGALTTGARNILIAYNLNLNSKDAQIAKEIAAKLRNSGAKQSCRAIGWYMNEYSRAQVSTNLTDYLDFNMHDAYEKCMELSKEFGVTLGGSEVIGLVPKEAILASGRYYASKINLKLDREEDLINLVINHLGLSSLAPFETDKKIIENLL